MKFPEPGDVVQLKSGGPSFVVASVTATQVNGIYYNPITGFVVGCQVPAHCIRVVNNKP